jgi:hypothetical protein
VHDYDDDDGDDVHDVHGVHDEKLSLVEYFSDSNIKNSDLEYIVGLRDFSTALGNYEPFFSAMALYDLKSKRRLTENYFTAYNNQFLPKLHGRPVNEYS